MLLLNLWFLPCDWSVQCEMGDGLKPEPPNPEEPSSSRAQSVRDDTKILSDNRESNEFSDSSKARKKYKDVADAAQAAFESAAYAAAAARAAVELSRSNGSFGPDDSSSPSPRKIDQESVKTGPKLENLECDSKAQTCSFSSSSLGSQKELYTDANDEVDDLPREPVPEATPHFSSGQQVPLRFQAGMNVEEDDSPLRLNLETGPISMRTRRLRGC